MPDRTDEGIGPYVVSVIYSCPQERSPHLLLMLGVQLGAGAGHMEHVGRGLTLRVDDRDFDIAAQFSHGRN